MTRSTLLRSFVLPLALLSLLSGCRSTPPPAPAETRRPGGIAMPGPSGPPPPMHQRANHSRGAYDSAPGAFDFYLLNLSWSPEYCVQNPSSPECAKHPGFVVHGLWPQNDDGTYPENCSNAPGPSDPSADLDLIPTLSLITHEWQTHGTCSGLDADTYFSTIRSAFHEVAIPTAFQADHAEQSLSPSAILAQFSAANPSFPSSSFALSCGNNQLTAIEVCLDKNLRAEACQGVRSCRANVVKITPQ